MLKWRQKGPLGKLHNIVVFIQRNPQRLANFHKLSGNQHVPRDNSTRWNSWKRMISKAIELKVSIMSYCSLYQENNDDILIETNWEELEKLNNFLVFFEDATLSTEAREATIEKYRFKIT
jgi:hypothetical protein